MASPRYQCLNAARQISKQGAGSRVLFSTSRIAQADQPPRPRSSATNDLLNAGDNIPSSSSFRAPKSQAAFTNPIQIEPTNPHDGLARMMEMNQRRAAARAQSRQGTSSAELSRFANSNGVARQITRRFKAGDVYAPHDLSEVEMAKWKRRDRPQQDVFDVLDFKPMDHYRNFAIMSEYMTPMGRIMHNSETGLRPVNQRRIARAIRRSVGLGLMPSVHRHPEVLYHNGKSSLEMRSPTRPNAPRIM